MTKVDPKIELDADVLRRVDAAARAQGRSREQVIEDSLRSSMAARELREVLARVRERSGLTEEEAAAIAVAERKVVRRQRKEAMLPPQNEGTGG